MEEVTYIVGVPALPGNIHQISNDKAICEVSALAIGNDPIGLRKLRCCPVAEQAMTKEQIVIQEAHLEPDQLGSLRGFGATVRRGRKERTREVWLPLVCLRIHKATHRCSARLSKPPTKVLLSTINTGRA